MDMFYVNLCMTHTSVFIDTGITLLTHTGIETFTFQTKRDKLRTRILPLVVDILIPVSTVLIICLVVEILILFSTVLTICLVVDILIPVSTVLIICLVVDILIPIPTVRIIFMCPSVTVLHTLRSKSNYTFCPELMFSTSCF